MTLADIPGAPTISGTGRPDLKNLFQLPAPHDAPFLKMLAHPAVIHRLNWMIGPGYKVTQSTALCHVKGSSGQMLHSGNTNPTCIGKHYEIANGRVHTRSGINVAWQLADVGPDDGGFVVVPGSHKSCYPLPHSVRTCNERAPIRHIPMRTRVRSLLPGGDGLSRGVPLGGRVTEADSALHVRARRPTPLCMALEQTVNAWLLAPDARACRDRILAGQAPADEPHVIRRCLMALTREQKDPLLRGRLHRRQRASHPALRRSSRRYSAGRGVEIPLRRPRSSAASPTFRKGSTNISHHTPGAALRKGPSRPHLTGVDMTDGAPRSTQRG